MAATDGPRGLVRVLAKPVGAHALVEAAPTYINLAHLLDAPVTTTQAGEVFVTLHLPGRTLSVKGDAATALDGYLRRQAVALPAEGTVVSVAGPDDEPDGR